MKHLQKKKRLRKWRKEEMTERDVVGASVAVRKTWNVLIEFSKQTGHCSTHTDMQLWMHEWKQYWFKGVLEMEKLEGLLSNIISLCLCACRSRFSCRVMHLYVIIFIIRICIRHRLISLSSIPLSCSLNPPSISIPPCCSVSLCRRCTAQTNLIQWTVSCKHVFLLHTAYLFPLFIH